MNARFNKLVSMTIVLTICQITSARAAIPDAVGLRIGTGIRSLPIASPIMSIATVADQMPITVGPRIGSFACIDIDVTVKTITQIVGQSISMKEHIIGKADPGIGLPPRVISSNSTMPIQRSGLGAFHEMVEIITNAAVSPPISAESPGQILASITSAIIPIVATNAPDHSLALS